MRGICRDQTRCLHSSYRRSCSGTFAKGFSSRTGPISWGSAKCTMTNRGTHSSSLAQHSEEEHKAHISPERARSALWPMILPCLWSQSNAGWIKQQANYVGWKRKSSHIWKSSALEWSLYLCCYVSELERISLVM